MRLVEKKFRVLLAVLLMVYTALFGTVTLLFPCLPLLYINRKLFHATIDYITGLWFGFAVFLLERVAKIKILVHHNKNDSAKENLLETGSSIVLMNHRTRLDWMFYFCVLYRMSALAKIKIILKRGLEKIPGLGWAMQLALFIFIRRKWEQDQEHISLFIKYFSQINKKIFILIFPEGTDLTENTMKVSDKFATVNNKPQYKYCLHPRTTGFSHIFSEMNANGMVNCVQDVTVAYKGGAIPQTELLFLQGNSPDEIHFYVDKFRVDEVLAGGDRTEAVWLTERWQKKEAVLNSFYVDGNESEKFQSSVQVNYTTDKQGEARFLFVYLIFWLVVCILGPYLLVNYLTAKFFYAASLIFFLTFSNCIQEKLIF